MRYTFLTTSSVSFFSNDPATTKIYTLSLHDALPISDELEKLPLRGVEGALDRRGEPIAEVEPPGKRRIDAGLRSEEHTSELQSLRHLVCRLLLEKKTLPTTSPSTSPPSQE